MPSLAFFKQIKNKTVTQFIDFPRNNTKIKKSKKNLTFEEKN